ncbi:MAG: GAP family protein [Rubrobacter sp.]|nr:GAP family protein [Rubrobacter sp.]
MLFPSDVIILLTVGVNLEHDDLGLGAVLPFIAATTLIAALPLLLYLLFYSRAHRLMPQVRGWMNTHSWLANIIVCVIFIALILF